MQNRRLLVAITLVGVLLLGAGGVWLASTYPSSYDEPTTMLDEDAPPEFTDKYRIEDTVRISGEPTYIERVFVVDGERFRTQIDTNRFSPDSNATLRSYTDSSENWTTQKGVSGEEVVFDPPEEETIRNETNGGGQSFVTAGPANQSVTEQHQEFASQMGANGYLGLVDYELRGEETYAGRTVAVYEPKDGWYGPAKSLRLPEYRILNAEGSVYLEEETNALLYADVSYTLVVASDYREYLYQRLTGEEVLEHELSWEFTDEGDVEEPEWMDELEDSEWADDLE